ncbi:uncharacterized protein LOC141910337 [Tubulanus polymorphus]|uniref:uncharacterized protein LOC141910337 n=1 Tax=Tubulanus polymorphus TaxID=672921 RepID=UPI003DA25D5A
MCYGRHLAKKDFMDAENICQEYSSYSHIFYPQSNYEMDLLYMDKVIKDAEEIGGYRYDRSTRTWYDLDGHRATELSPTSDYCIELHINHGYRATSCFNRLSFACKVPNIQCSRPLGVKDGRIEDILITADNFDSDWEPHYARLDNYAGAWCVNSGQVPSFLEIEFSDVEKVFVRGGWGEWSDYSPCSASCGEGSKTRSRMCNNPIPRHRGKQCNGPSSDVVECALRDCPGYYKEMPDYAGTSEVEDEVASSGSCRTMCNEHHLKGCIGYEYVGNNQCKLYRFPFESLSQPVEGAFLFKRICHKKPPSQTRLFQSNMADEYSGCFSKKPNTLISSVFTFVKGFQTAEQCMLYCMESKDYCFAASYSPIDFNCLVSLMYPNYDDKTSIYIREGDDKFYGIGNTTAPPGFDPIENYPAGSNISRELCQAKCYDARNFECAFFISYSDDNCALFELEPVLQDYDGTDTYIRTCLGPQSTEMWRTLHSGLFAGETEIDFSAIDLTGVRLPDSLFDGAKYVTKIKMANISSIPNGLFDGLENLEELDLSSPETVTIAPDVFGNLKHLKQIKINFDSSSLIHYRMISASPVLKLDINALIEFREIVQSPDVVPCGRRNCYLQCGSPEFLRRDEENGIITIYETHLDLNQILTEVEDRTDLRQLRIFAFSVSFRGHFIVRYDLQIVAKTFYMEEGSYLKFNVRPTTNRELLGCRTRFIRTSDASRTQVAISYDDAENLGSLLLVASEIVAPFHCTVASKGSFVIPAQRLDFLQTAVFCAKSLVENGDSENFDIGVDLLQEVAAVASAEALRNSGCPANNDLLQMSYLARQNEMDVTLHELFDVHNVPPMSMETYRGYSRILATMLRDYIDNIRFLEKNKQNTADSLSRIRASIREMDQPISNMESLKNDGENAFRVASRTILMLEHEFRKAREKSSATLKRLRDNMADMENLDILSIVSGVFSNTDDVSPAVIVSGVSDLAITIRDILNMEAVIKDIIRVSSSFTTGVEGGSIEDIYDKRTVKGTARLRVQIGKWKVMKTMIENRLDGMTIPAIATYINDVKAALAEMTVWGEALTKEAINIGVRVQSVTRMRQNLRLSQIYKAELQEEYEKSKAGNKVTKQLLNKVYRKSFYYRELVYDVIRSYCQSKFYNEFTDCSTDDIPLLRHDLHTVLIKIQSTTLFQLEPDLRCSSKPLNVYLNLRDNGDCASGGSVTESECPITLLKRDRRVHFVIDIDEPAFADYERIRIVEVRIVVHGAQSNNGELGVLLSRAGEFSDRYRGQIYRFFGTGRAIGYKYMISTEEIMEFGCMYNENQDALSALPPFTTWTIQIQDASIDLSHVTRVELKFLTYSSNTAQCDENAIGSARVRRSDDSISPACLGNN